MEAFESAAAFSAADAINPNSRTAGTRRNIDIIANPRFS
jgi:hypothetical protein